ncbi:MAG TPA: hypothetical protein VNJ01_07480 [Bacteriovoracaceae bacterium]|nr:hypothetical protein [Bacteriovoracaceae bacterium]
MKSFFVLLTFLMTLSATAAEYKLAVITSEFDNDTTDFFLETNDAGEMHSIRYVSTSPSGQITEDNSIPAETVLREGGVLAHRQGRDVVKLFVEPGFNIKVGGDVRLTYLQSGVSNNWRFIPLKVTKEGEGFKLTDAENSLVNRLFMLVNRSRLFGIIGIKEIQYYFE